MHATHPLQLASFPSSLTESHLVAQVKCDTMAASLAGAAPLGVVLSSPALAGSAAESQLNVFLSSGFMLCGVIFLIKV